MTPAIRRVDRCGLRVDPVTAAGMAALVAEISASGVPGSAVPIVYAMRLLADVAGKAGWTHDPAEGVWLHESQSIRATRPLRPSEQLSVTCDVASGMADATLSASASGVEGQVIETVTRLRRGSPAVLLGARAAGKNAAGRQGDRAPLLSAPLTGKLVAAYAELSGDPNPLHLDLALARSLGFPERVVHGMLVAALVEPALAAAGLGSAVTELRVRFIAPVFVGERVGVSIVSARGEEGRARSVISVEDGPIACIADVRTES